MDNFTSNIIVKKVSKLSIIAGIAGIIGLFGLIITSLLYNHVKVKSEIGFLFIILMIFGFVLGIVKLKFGKFLDYRIVDKLIINESQLQIGRNVFTLQDLQNLRFYFNGIKGEAVARGIFSDGSDNLISFKTQNEVFHYKFLILDMDHKQSFIRILELLYQAKYDFIENHYNLGRTCLLQKLNYRQIKTFKEKYK